MHTNLHTTIAVVENGLAAAPAYVDDQGPDAWAASFAARQKALRLVVGEAIVVSGTGHYLGDIGDHGLDMCRIGVISDGGYNELLTAWLGVAREIATETAGAA